METLKGLYLAFFIGSACLFANAGLAQTTTDNYVISYNAQTKIVGDLSAINDKSQVTQITGYFDGIGRPIQSIAKQNTRSGYDFVTFLTYDAYGRKTSNYNPYP